MIPDVTWEQVVYTLIVTVPAIIAALYARNNTTQLKTGNDKTVGDMVTEVHAKEATPPPPDVPPGP